MTDFEERYIKGVTGGKRLGIRWTPWMGDWFVSHSPRNGNSHAEGPWDQWVDMAVSILQHDFTRITRPEAHEAAQGLPLRDYYDESDVYLTDEQIEKGTEL